MLFSIGAVIDEAQGQQDRNNYLAKSNSFKARSLLALKWTVIGYLLTISYKSVLRAILMKKEYDNTIDTIDDMLQSGRQLILWNDIALISNLVETDPRTKVKEIAANAEYVTHGTKIPEWIVQG